VVESVVREMLPRKLPASRELEQTRAKLTAQLTAVETELQHLVEGLAK